MHRAESGVRPYVATPDIRVIERDIVPTRAEVPGSGGP
jgi:hypothetical protein